MKRLQMTHTAQVLHSQHLPAEHFPKLTQMCM